MARPSACSLPCSADAANCSRAVVSPSSATMSATTGCPFVSVPVLSKTNVIDLARQVERGGVLDENAGTRAAHADRDRRRRREAERARA